MIPQNVCKNQVKYFETLKSHFVFSAKCVAAKHDSLNKWQVHIHRGGQFPLPADLVNGRCSRYITAIATSRNNYISYWYCCWGVHLWDNDRTEKQNLNKQDRTTTLMDRCMVYYVRANKIGLHFDGQVYCVHTNKTQCDHHYCTPKQNNITGYHLYCSGHFSLKDKVQNQHELHDNILDTFISKLWR